MSPKIRFWGFGARHAALDYKIAEVQENAEICLGKSEVTKHVISRYFQIPRTPEDLIARNRLIEFGTHKGNGIVLFIKEIGTDVLFTLLQCCRRVDRELGTGYLDSIQSGSMGHASWS